MIDFTLFWFTLAVLVVGVVYACLCTHVAGEDAPERKSNVLRFVRRRARPASRPGPRP